MRTTNAKAEAKYNVTTEFPSLGLHAAAATGNMGLVEYAIARGQPVNSVLDGVLPLHAACAGGSEPVVKLLIDHGADVNGPRLPRRYSNEKNPVIIGTSGSTPLHFAAANGNISIAKLLLRRGAIADRPDKHGVTPEMVARQNGYIECADYLHSWICNKDRDLRERETRSGMGHRDQQSPERADTPDIYGDAASGSKRLKVKRSIDTALSMLKASSSGLSEQYQKTAPPSISTNPRADHRADVPPRKLSDAGPRSPTLAEDGPPPGFDPNQRRPSLPQPLGPSPSPSRSSNGTSRFSSRRPRSAGSDVEETEPHNFIPYGRGGAGRRLANKYSMRNFLKKGRDGSVTPSFGDPFGTQQAESYGPSSSILGSGHHTPMSSSPPHHAHSASDTVPSSYASTLTAMGPSTQPSSSRLPSAVDLHNALAQQQRSTLNRDRSVSAASGTRFAIPTQSQCESAEQSSAGGASRASYKDDSGTGLVRARSPSGAGGGTNRGGGVYDEDVVGASGAPAVKRPGILRPHNRTSSSGQSSSSVRALRFDSSSSLNDGSPSVNGNGSSSSRAGLRGCNSVSSLKHVTQVNAGRRPGSAGNPVSRVSSEASADITTSPAVENEEDDSYGEIIHSQKKPDYEQQDVHRRRGFSVNSTDSTTSPGILLSEPAHGASVTSEFPFSICRPPPVSCESDKSSPQLLRVPLPTDNGARGRGDSLSSVSSTGSHEPSLTTSSTSRSDGSTTTTAIVDSMTRDYSPGRSHANINERRAHSPLGIDMAGISSHAEAEALVQKAQQDIMVADHEIPLSARLAAYGESLALERRLREEMEKQEKGREGRGSILIAHGPMSEASSPSLMTPGLPSTPLASGGRLTARSWSDEADRLAPLGGERNMGLDKGERRRRRKSMVKVPRRPHTSTGATGHTIMPDIAVNGRRLRTVSDDPRTHHVCHSTSSLEGLQAPDALSEQDTAQLPPSTPVRVSETRKPALFDIPPTAQLSRVNSLDVTDTDEDADLGSALCRVSTAPHMPSLASRGTQGAGDQARKASAQKLARMGFSPHDRTPANTKRFGGLKSWVQSLKGKPV